MHRLVWTDEALEDLTTIVAYIAERNIAAALKLRAAISDTADKISRDPLIYRGGRVQGTREAVVHPNYIIVYRADTEMVEVAAVLHARMRYP
ncbi:MAG TPA: type II toxin-antitoxin system mRNA interferase toxin, RelE/StbE family [Acetobacteraceae bacterium]|jgi:toxin ParE1/3/4|nr:type II toxin-antitoxin system mRNA interferase toxin, RelE/StbE family [Acetobacteraceae bacterium]